MAELADILEQNAIPTKRIIHDCVDTGSTLALTGATEINLPCDAVARNYKSTAQDLWTPGTSIVKDSIDNSELRVKIKLTLNGAVNSICTIRAIVPHPTFGDIEIDNFDMILYKNNIDTNFTAFLMLYNGTDSEAKDYGFKITIEPSAGMDLKARSILVSI